MVANLMLMSQRFESVEGSGIERQVFEVATLDLVAAGLIVGKYQVHLVALLPKPLDMSCLRG